MKNLCVFIVSNFWNSFFETFCIQCRWPAVVNQHAHHLGPRGSSNPPGVSIWWLLGSLGASQGPPLGSLGNTWDPLGLPVGAPGPLWGALGSLIGRRWAAFGTSRGVCGPSWSPLRPPLISCWSPWGVPDASQMPPRCLARCFPWWSSVVVSSVVRVPRMCGVLTS